MSLTRYGCNVYAYGPFDKPRYRAFVGGHEACCPIGKGHRTPEAAASHLARLVKIETKRLYQSQGTTE